MKLKTYSALAQATGLGAKHFKAMAFATGWDAKELCEHSDDLVMGFDTGIGLVYTRDAMDFVRKYRGLIQDVFNRLEGDSRESDSRGPLLIVMDKLNAGMHGEHYTLSEVASVLYNPRYVSDEMDCAVVAWWLYGLWFEYVAGAINLAQEA